MNDRNNDEEAINRILFLLELSQAKDFDYMSKLTKQIENMEEQIKELNQQLNLVKEQIPQEKGIRERVEEICLHVEKKGNQALEAVAGLKTEIADKARESMKEMQQSGEMKLYSFFDKTHLQEKLCAVKQALQEGMEVLEKGIQKVDRIMNELSQGKEHIKTAAGIIKGKEKETAGNQKGEKGNVISRLLNTILEAYKGMAGKTDQFILAYDRLEESVMKKNPSVLKKISQYKDSMKDSSASVAKSASKDEPVKNKAAEQER